MLHPNSSCSSSSFLTSRSRVSPPLPLSLPWNLSPKRFHLHCSSSSTRCSKPNNPSSRNRRYGGVIPSILRSLDSSSSTSDIETTLASLSLSLSPKEQTVLLKEQTRWDKTLRLFKLFQSHKSYTPNVIHYNILLRSLGRACRWDELRLCWIDMSRTRVLPTNTTYSTLVDVYGKAGLVKEALLWVKHMDQRTMLFPDEVTMATVVRVLKNSNHFDVADTFFKAWRDGRIVLDFDSLSNLDSDSSPVSLKEFLSMELFKVGARRTSTTKIDSPSSPRKPRLTSTYNALIDLYGKAGRLEDAAALFSEMLKSGVAVDTVTFNTMIHICGSHGRLCEAESLLKKMEEKGVKADTKTYNILLSLHADAGDIEAALRYYRKILFPDTVTHRAVLHVLCRRRMVKEAEDVLEEMDRNSIRIDEHSVPVVMRMYVDEGMIGQAKALLERVQLDCVLSSTTLAAVIDVYAERGLWVEAEAVFYGKRDVNDVLEYNVMIKAYGMAKLHEKALCLFKGMKKQGTWPDECTYNSIVQMLSGVDLVDEAQRVLAEMMDSDCKPSCKTFSSLIASYVRLGLLSDAVDVYEGMRKAGVEPNEVVYGSLVNGFAESGMVEEAIHYFRAMEENGVQSNNIVLTSLIKAYSKVGCLEEARRVYDKMKKDSETGPDVAASNSMLSLCADLGMVSEAETIFNELRGKGTCDVITFATMMYLYKGMGMLDEAIEVAEEMRESGLLNDCASFNQVMACYAADGQLRECCELFREMLVERKLSLDWGTYKTLFTLLKKGGVPREAVAQLQDAYDEGKPLVTSAIAATLFSAMGLHAYAVESCREVTRDDGDIPLEHYAYNAVIYGYGAAGDTDMALKAYMRMQEKGLKPDMVTQVYLVGVYGKAGMVEGVKRVHSWITFGEIEANQSLFRAVREAYVSANRQDLADVVKKEMSIAFEEGKEEEEEEEYSSGSGEEEDESEEDEAF